MHQLSVLSKRLSDYTCNRYKLTGACPKMWTKMVFPKRELPRVLPLHLGQSLALPSFSDEWLSRSHWPKNLNNT